MAEQRPRVVAPEANLVMGQSGRLAFLSITPGMGDGCRDGQICHATKSFIKAMLLVFFALRLLDLFLITQPYCGTYL